MRTKTLNKRFLCSFLFLAVAITVFGQKTSSAAKERPFGASFIVPDDGDLYEAFAKAEEREDTSKRYVIFIRNGFYYLGGDDGGTIEAEGAIHKSPKTTLNSPNVTLKGESMENTLIWNQPVYEGLSITATLMLAEKSSNTHIEDLTIQNAYPYMEKGGGRAIALEDRSIGTVMRRVRMLSYQDTYFTNNKKGKTRLYECEIHGTVDFICGDGDVLFDHCRIVLEDRKNGDCITAPGIPLDKGYVFSGCTIEGPSGQDGKYSLGRPWKIGSRCHYINTRMNVLPRKEGWSVMRDFIIPAAIDEYNSTNEYGEQIDLSDRISVWKTAVKAETEEKAKTEEKLVKETPLKSQLTKEEADLLLEGW